MVCLARSWLDLDAEYRAVSPSYGHENIFVFQVSDFNKEPDSQVADSQTRPLAEEYPFLIIDALYQRIRRLLAGLFP